MWLLVLGWVTVRRKVEFEVDLCTALQEEGDWRTDRTWNQSYRGPDLR